MVGLLISAFSLGPNALRALKGLGLLDSLVARQSERGALSSFQFRSGLADREFTYDVSESLSNLNALTAHQT